jgi:hypothetical protein
LHGDRETSTIAAPRRSGRVEKPSGVVESGSQVRSDAEADHADHDLVDLVLAAEAERVAADQGAATPELVPRLSGVVIGVLAGLRGTGEPLVDFDPNPTGEPVPARSTAALDEGAIGREVALMFEGGDAARPIVIGLLHEPTSRAAEATPSAPLEVEADGERVVVSAERELVLRCGKASITLTRAGKILIRGAYVLTRSSGVNRIQGGTVEIN